VVQQGVRQHSRADRRIERRTSARLHHIVGHPDSDLGRREELAEAPPVAERRVLGVELR